MVELARSAIATTRSATGTAPTDVTSDVTQPEPVLTVPETCANTLHTRLEDDVTVELRDVRELTIEGTFRGPAICGAADLSGPDDLVVDVDAADVRIGVVEFDASGSTAPPLIVTILTVQNVSSTQITIHSCGVTEYAYRGRDALGYAHLAEAYPFDEEPLTHFVTLLMAIRLGGLAPNVRTVPAVHATQRMNALPPNWKQRVFPSSSPSTELLSLGTISTHSDMNLLVQYLTSGTIGPRSGAEEADRLLTEMLSVGPHLNEIVASVVFEAFDERPSDPRKQYHSYQTVRMLEPPAPIEDGDIGPNCPSDFRVEPGPMGTDTTSAPATATQVRQNPRIFPGTMSAAVHELPADLSRIVATTAATRSPARTE